MAAISVWMYVIRQGPMTLTHMLLGPLVGGGVLILWILFLHYSVAGDRADGLGLRTDRRRLEIGLGCLLGAIFLAFHFAYFATAARLFPPRPPASEILQLLVQLSHSPALLALWLGPVVWIGVAGFEELWRVFVLRRLFCAWPSPAGHWIAVLLVSALFAAAHGYQGPAAVVSIGIIALAKGFFYLATGRFWALVVAHAVYDSVQIVLAVVQIRQAGL
jgi:membrane protease YdiL (CAAX protease family)